MVGALLACGGSRAPAPARPQPTTAPHVESRSDDKCDKLIAHALTLAVAERPADQKLTDAERTSIETQLRASWIASCRQMTAAGYDCAVAATSIAELERCDAVKAPG